MLHLDLAVIKLVNNNDTEIKLVQLIKLSFSNDYLQIFLQYSFPIQRLIINCLI